MSWNKTVLFFTDAHVTPKDNMTRFNRLSDLILQYKPDIIVQGGDFVSLDSFSRWDKDKRLKIEGRRYKLDIESANLAIKHIVNPLIHYNEVMIANKKRQYKPHWLWFQGNHEYWADEYVNRNPEVEGVINIQQDLNLNQLPGTVDYIPFKTEDWFRIIDGVCFCHAPRNRSGLLSSKYIADKALEVMNTSVVFGHSHRLLTSSVKRAGSDVVHRSICGGCFFDKDPDYSVGHNNDYWRGVLLLSLHGGGNLSYSAISL